MAMPQNMMGGDPAQPDQTDSETGADTGPDDSTEGGFTIEIQVDGSGAITLSVESASDEGAEGGEGGSDQDSAQPVKDAKAAGQLVTDIINNQGQVSGDAGAEKQSGFDSVFQGGANG